MLDKIIDYMGNVLEIALYGAVLAFVLIIIYTAVVAIGFI
jgi:hypothetical protein